MGMFSWFTSDSKKRIVADKTRNIYMTGNDGRVFHLKDFYEGYGIFGGKDYYEFLAELNGLPSDRDEGIALAYSGKSYESPKLFSNKKNVLRTNEYSRPEDDPNQGFILY